MATKKIPATSTVLRGLTPAARDAIASLGMGHGVIRSDALGSKAAPPQGDPMFPDDARNDAEAHNARVLQGLERQGLIMPGVGYGAYSLTASGHAVFNLIRKGRRHRMTA